MTHPAVQRRWVAVDHPRWRQAHAPSVLDADGDLLAAWFAGTGEGAPDSRVWAARRSGGTTVWDQPVVLSEGPVAHWNPVLTHGPDGAVWLFYKRGERISRWSTWYRRSLDGGATWSSPAELVAGDRGGRGPVKNPPIVLSDGTWLAPASVERWDTAPQWEAFVDRSEDGGRTWTAAPIPLERNGLRGAGVIQPALWRRGDTVFALMRSTEGVAYRSRSDDGGRTWSSATPTTLANNNSGLTVVALPGGGIACVHNPVTESWGPRCPLVVSVSPDDGESWREAVTLEDGVTPVDEDPTHCPGLPPAHGFTPDDTGVQTTGVGEYSYPGAVLTGGAVTVTYSWQRRGIVEATVPLDLLHH